MKNNNQKKGMLQVFHQSTDSENIIVINDTLFLKLMAMIKNLATNNDLAKRIMPDNYPCNQK